MKTLILILNLIVIFWTNSLFAETVLLKSGKSIEGKILERTDEHIKIRVNPYGIVLNYPLDDIENINEEKIHIPENSSSMQNVLVEKDIKDILAKIKSANKNVKRFQSKAIRETKTEQFLYIKTEEALDIDYEQKVIHNIVEVKDFDFGMGDFLKNYLDKNIQDAKQKGVPLEKIQQMQKLSEKLSLEMQEMKNRLSEKMKGRRMESFFVEGIIYIRVKDKWIKMESPFLSAFWKIFLEFQQGQFNKEEFRRTLDNYPVNIKKALEPILAYIELHGNRDIYDISSIAEGKFEGKTSYVVNVKSEDMVNVIKDSLLAYAQTRGERNIQMDVNSFSCKEFVSKENYLKLGTKMDMEVTMHNPTRIPQHLKTSTSGDTIYSYPSGKVNLPLELMQATAINDEAELKKILMQEQEDIFKEMPSNF